MASRIDPTMPPTTTIIAGSSMEVSAFFHHGIDFVFVEIGDLAEHLVHLAGFFTDGQHVQRHIGEHVLTNQGCAQQHAFLHHSP